MKMSSHNSSLASSIQHRREATQHLLRSGNLLRPAVGAVLLLSAAFIRALKRNRTRQILATLDDHQLRDIGLSRADLSKL